MKSVLLVHGAWHGSWCWEIVQNSLIENGVDTHSVNLPFTGVEDDISAVREAIASIDNEIILVGHSYGGIVISKAAEDTEKVTQLIYLCAILLEPGETMQLDGSKIEIDVDDALISVVKPQAIIPAFYADVDSNLAKQSIERLRPFPIVAGTVGVGEAWRDVPSTYIVCKDDAAIPSNLQYSMARRASRLIEWECAHSPFFSNPELLIDFLEDLALPS